jgi:hypothetical protein
MAMPEVKQVLSKFSNRSSSSSLLSLSLKTGLGSPGVSGSGFRASAPVRLAAGDFERLSVVPLLLEADDPDVQCYQTFLSPSLILELS